jgi:hypothetical protein
MKTEKVIWGLILIFIGAVFLLNNFGVINFYWGSVWRFWPIIFILIGANMLFSRLNGSTGSILSVSLTLVALIFLGYQGTREPEHRMGRSWFKFDHDDWDSDSDTAGNEANGTASNTFTELYSGNIKRAELNIKGGATSYRLDDTTSNLFNAEVKQNHGNYTLEKTSRDSVEILNFRMRNKKQKWNMDDMDGNEVNIELNANPVWDINVEMGAGETNFDLTQYKVSNLQLNGGAASFKVKLPVPVTTTNVTVETGVAEVDIKVPQASACRITVESGLSSKDFSGFEKQADGSYQTSNYNTSAKKIQIQLKGGLSSFEVSRY